MVTKAHRLLTRHTPMFTPGRTSLLVFSIRQCLSWQITFLKLTVGYGACIKGGHKYPKSGRFSGC